MRARLPTALLNCKNDFLHSKPKIITNIFRYLDRIADTLPNTISLSFPPITDTGVFKRLALSTQGRATRELTKVGMPMAHVCNFIGDALIRQMPHYVPMLSIDAVSGVLPHCEPLLYAHLLSTKLLNEKRAAFSQLAAVITPASLLADIVGLQPDQITEDALVKSFGLDSLGGGRISLYTFRLLLLILF